MFSFWMIKKWSTKYGQLKRAEDGSNYFNSSWNFQSVFRKIENELKN